MKKFLYLFIMDSVIIYQKFLKLQIGIYGMDMSSDRLDNLLRFNFFEGDITINKEWIEYRKKM